MWGEGYHFHPDENNLAQAVLNLSQKNDPQFYSYGQLPIFLSLFSAQLYNLFSFIHQQKNIDFNEIIFFLRFWSAIAGVASVFWVYYLGKIIINRRGGVIAALVTAFLPGLIQSAHFGTTESLLAFFYLTIIYCSIKLYQKRKLVNFVWVGLSLGLALATKASAVLFILTPLMAILLLKTKNYPTKKLFLGLLTMFLIALAVTIFFSPFLVIDHLNSLNALGYEVAIAQGKKTIFYTRQFLNTKPFLFQIKKIFPFSIGWPVLLLAPLGIIPIITNKKDQKRSFLWLIILVPALIFFLYQGQLFVKWTRFMTPLLPIFSLLFAQIAVSMPKIIQFIVLVVSILPGLIFFDLVYSNPDTRYQFSNWAKENLPESSLILSESGNVINLPLEKINNLKVINFDFYQLEERSSQDQLSQILEKADYLLVPSRRIFANHHQDQFPNTASYYQKLFSGQLGFIHLKTFSPTNRWFPLNYYYQQAEINAEETWTVFDHPTVRIYQKKHPYSKMDYQQMLFTSFHEQ